MKSQSRKLLIVDDDPLVGAGFEYCFGDQYAIMVVSSGEAALAAAKREVFSVVVLDLRMERMSGIETLQELKKLNPRQQIIIFTGYLTAESAMSATNHGAFRYVTKPFHLEELREHLTQAFAQYEHELAVHSGYFASPEELENFGLSSREAEICYGIIQNKTTEEIAQSLKISPRTTEKYIEKLYAHFEVKNRVKLIEKIKKAHYKMLHSPPKRK